METLRPERITPASRPAASSTPLRQPVAGISLSTTPVEPNLPLLQNALDQTRGSGRCDAHDWVALVRARLGSFDMKAIGEDVRPFLERTQDAGLLTRDNLLGLLRSTGGRRGR